MQNLMKTSVFIRESLITIPIMVLKKSMQFHENMQQKKYCRNKYGK